MKLIYAIVHDDDSRKLMDELNLHGFSVTRLCSTGGFLKSGNTTLLVGVEKDKVDQVIHIIRKNSRSRKQVVDSTRTAGFVRGMVTAYPSSMNDTDVVVSPDITEDMRTSYPVEVVVGGAIVFVLNVERFEKV